MTEGSCQSGQTQSHRPTLSEPITTNHAQATEEVKPGQPRQHVEASATDDMISTAPTKRRAVFKRPLLLTVAVVLGSLALLAAVRYYQYLVTHEWTDDAFIEGHIIPISSQVAGHVLQVYVTDNQEVHQGDVLLEIDAHDYAARLAQARAVLQAAIAKQEAAQNNVTLIPMV